ncbi:16S rRNA (cytosine(1402)-N(4))-methyltransferase [Candidatus Shapirobacteria bacterium CG_4_8_14_3_um_filter_39_11]|uniref:Ribosomal RNA small subunit methyltransferase H n=1 Tax=Candidatus Shapirobacteria bacterium CG_4_8_14_3_um_filter_39_11 TaxID=1974875 RepID=A0A2M8GFN5_9BACT|nr:MAG: 16S rRNA (cytosine(1402)-N(4))-methyltransferase [Candidatus Shapirobacteria bacterium CG_4_8_14_3_um_filter_39_11]
MGTYHVPALLNETVDLLNIRPGKKYLDATLGGGGHSEEIVKRGGILLGIDQDPEALSYASIRLKQACPGLTPPKFAKGNFVNLAKLAEENGFEKVDGVLFDLGVSSHQFESASRGFSFSQEVSLDMRMDPALSVTAKDLINGLTEKELAELFTKLGEEKFSGRYAKAIVRYRQNKQIEKCSELAQIIVSQAPPSEKFRKIHPATRVFQALRIAVNDELNSLKESLPQSVDLLNQGGRLVVISFHSLEDGVVKRFFLEKQKQNILKIINSKPIIPSGNEIKLNPRSRSAKLRGAEKL